MQLTFPNGEHPSVPLQGEVAVGTRPGLRVSLPGSGLAAHHASFISDRRGLWLRVPNGAPACISMPARCRAWPSCAPATWSAWSSCAWW